MGIGGVGMSGIATVLAERGEEVSGCDRGEGAPLERLRAQGIECRVPHDRLHLEGVTTVVVSGAIAADEPELAEARHRGLEVLHRADALAGLLAEYRQRVVVTGSHGKTTTTGMVAFALSELGFDPTFLVGGDVPQLGTNARAGSGGTCVAEGDESDRSVARLPATIGVVLNAELDHLDHYASIDGVLEVFGTFAMGLAPTGLLVLGDGLDLPTAARVAHAGVGPGPGLRALDATPAGAFRPSRGPGAVQLSVPGVHNAGNACCAALVLEELGVPLADGFRALERFTGAARRFQVLGERDGFTVVDDYAHHPTELAATIAAARARHPGRLVVYFQPHMPWRTRAFAAGFADALRGADAVVLSETYVARGRPDPDASAVRIAELLAGRKVVFAPDYTAAIGALRDLARPGDLVLCCGAGPVDQVARAVVAP
jgi:UDP-N-acetylmuramate--alanine ligase